MESEQPFALFNHTPITYQGHKALRLHRQHQVDVVTLALMTGSDEEAERRSVRTVDDQNVR